MLLRSTRLRLHDETASRPAMCCPHLALRARHPVPSRSAQLTRVSRPSVLPSVCFNNNTRRTFAPRTATSIHAPTPWSPTLPAHPSTSSTVPSCSTRTPPLPTSPLPAKTSKRHLHASKPPRAQHPMADCKPGSWSAAPFCSS